MPELVPTYFVHFDENFELKQTEKFQDSDQDSVREENKTVRLWIKVYRRSTKQHKTLNERHSSFQAVFQSYIQNFCIN